MTSQDNISSEEADLMLYLFDELDATQREAFESRLKGDESLRRRLAELREVEGKFSLQPKAVSALASERALKSSLRVVREQILLQNSIVPVSPRFRIPAYAFAAGIAVVFTLGFITWLYTTPPVSNPPSSPGPQANRGFSGPGGPGGGYGVSSGFVPPTPDMYAESSREIDQEIDALSMLADFEDASDRN